MTKVVVVLMVLVAPAAYLGVFSIPVYLGATFLFALWLIHRTNAQQGGTLRAARPTATGKRAPFMSLPTPNLPPGISPTERIGELNFAEAYERTAEELRQMLLAVANHESAESFVEEAVRKLRATAAATPEFYIGEFYDRFQKAMRDDAKAEIASCERETEQIATAGKGATADLNARLDIARTAGDQDVEHAIWREGEQRKAEYQAAIDGLTDRLNLGTWRLRAVDALGLALGGQRKPAGERSQAATTVNGRSSRSERNPSMGPVETTVRDGITPGAVLSTPTGRGQFTVAEIGAKGPVLLLGRRAARTLIPWAALEGVPGFLGDEGWSVIGGVFDQAADPTTLDGYMKKFVNRATAGWVACLLEAAGVVDIDRRPPASVRTRPDFSRTADLHATDRGVAAQTL